MWTGMMRSNPAVTEDQVEQFELAHGFSLPQDYRKFLLATNGGVPREVVFPLKDYPYDTHWQLKVFLSLGGQWPTESLSYPLDLYRGALLLGVLPIASDDLGNYVCLDLRDGSSRVVFWDHRHYWSTGEWRENELYQVANSFAQFLAVLDLIGG